MKTKPSCPTSAPFTARRGRGAFHPAGNIRRAILSASVAGLLALGAGTCARAGEVYTANASGVVGGSAFYDLQSGASPVTASAGGAFASAGLTELSASGGSGRIPFPTYGPNAFISFGSGGDASFSTDRFLLDPLGGGVAGSLSYSYTASGSPAVSEYYPEFGGDWANGHGAAGGVGISSGPTSFSARSDYSEIIISFPDPRLLPGGILPTLADGSGVLPVYFGDSLSLSVWAGGNGGPSGSATLFYNLTIYEDRKHWTVDPGGTLIPGSGAQWFEGSAPGATQWAAFNKELPRNLGVTMGGPQQWRGLIVDGETLDLDLSTTTLTLGSDGLSQKTANIIVGEGRPTDSTLILRNGTVNAARGIDVDGHEGSNAELILDGGASVLLSTISAANPDGFLSVVGLAGSGRLTVRGGSTFATDAEILLGGGGSAADGILSVAGSGSAVIAKEITVGLYGRGSLLISSGAHVGVERLQSGTAILDPPVLTSVIQVDGANSYLSITDHAYLGAEDGQRANVFVSNGGQLIADGATVELENQSLLSVGGVGSEVLGGTYSVRGESQIVVFGGGSMSSSGVAAATPLSFTVDFGSSLEVTNGIVLGSHLATAGVVRVRGNSLISMIAVGVSPQGFLDIDAGNVTSSFVTTSLLAVDGRVVANNCFLFGHSAAELTIGQQGDVMVSGGTRAEFASATVGEIAGTGGHLTVDGAGTTLSSTTTDVYGRLTVSNGGSISGTTLTIYERGVLDGAGGTLHLSTINLGVVRPGASPGILTIDGDYTQESGGTLVLEIGGLVLGTQYDQLVVTGNAVIDGTVVFSFIDGFAPLFGQTFELLDVDGTLGGLPAFEFEGLQDGWLYSTEYDSGTGLFTLTSLSNGVTTTPEPGTALFGLILGVFGLGRRQRCGRAERLLR